MFVKAIDTREGSLDSCKAQPASDDKVSKINKQTSEQKPEKMADLMKSLPLPIPEYNYEALAPETKNRAFRYVTAQIMGTDGKEITTLIDPGSATSLITRRTLQTHFPEVKIQHMKDDHVVLAGLTARKKISQEFVNLPTTLRTRKGDKQQFKTEVHIVEEAPFEVLMGTQTLYTQQMHLLFNSSNGKPALMREGELIDMQVYNPKPLKKRRKVLAEETFIIQTGTGLNIPVKFKELPPANKDI
jgi:hypothetical protein